MLYFWGADESSLRKSDLFIISRKISSSGIIKPHHFKTSPEMVPEMGLEPIWISPFDFKSNAYTNSAIRAKLARVLEAPFCPLGRNGGSKHASVWRRRPELNRCTRFCRPLRNHSATAPNIQAPARHRVILS